ncbi:orotate phosphoribosyltransferase [Patescibacteria group bacterium]|nr:orotate phosphoribosyltransferase [Patescibacteria group bacterium]
MLADEIAKLLLEKGAVKINLEEPFTWTSGIRSPIYCDNRALVSSVDAREEILAGFLQKIKESGIEFDAVAGVATGAIAFGMLVADRLKKPFVYVRLEPRDHGTGKQVEGSLEKNSKVLVIEDLFSTAGSTVKAVAALRSEISAEVVGVVAISTYEFEKAAARLEEAEVKWWTLTNFTAIVGQLEISDDEKKAVLEFSADPSGWFANFSKK